MAGRFDYIKYDEIATKTQEGFKKMCETMEAAIGESLPDSRAKALAYHYLEITYMWMGKAIRDEQITRNSALNK